MVGKIRKVMLAAILMNVGGVTANKPERVARDIRAPASRDQQGPHGGNNGAPERIR
jgi:hypothetical protein